MRDRRGLGRVVVERRQERAAPRAARRSTALTEPGPPPRAPWPARRCLVDRGVVGHAVQERELEQPEPQRGAAPADRARRRGRPRPADDVVERRPALHRAVGQTHGQRAVARIEPARLGVQRAVGVGALLEDAAHDRERAEPRRGAISVAGPPSLRGRAGSRRRPSRARPAGWTASSSSAPRRSRAAGGAVERQLAGRPASGAATPRWTPQRLAVGELDARADVRGQRAHDALELDGRPRRVEHPVRRGRSSRRRSPAPRPARRTAAARRARAPAARRRAPAGARPASRRSSSAADRLGRLEAHRARCRGPRSRA